jgi:hypothetical protein
LHDLRSPSSTFTEACSGRDRQSLSEAYGSGTSFARPGSERQCSPNKEQGMTDRDTQRLADASEDDAAQRYQRGKVLATVVDEAMRRADAMTRLDASLRLATRRRAVS